MTSFTKIVRSCLNTSGFKLFHHWHYFTCALMTCLLLGASSSGQAQEKTNFMIILCDDLGYGDLGCFGNVTIRTPHLDRLASQGARLTDCYATAPVCSPSRAGLLTGRTPNRLGIYDWIPSGHAMHLRKEEITLASLLKSAGYDTAHIGKWHCNGKFHSPEQPQPGDHGFNYWFSTQNNASPTHENPVNFVRNGEKVGPLEGFSCDIVAEEAIHWLDTVRQPDKPFFQFVCFHEPHEPIASPTDLTGQYPEAKKKGEALYYANVSNMDRAVGKLMAALDQRQLTGNTVVYFTSDNGPETLNRYGGAWRSHGSPGPLRGMKLHIYEGGIRVPGIVRWPGKTEAGSVVSEPISAVDLLPTFCAEAGVELPIDRTLDGADFRPAFRGESIERRHPLYWHYFSAFGKPKVAMRSGNWKIAAHWDGPDYPPGSSLRKGQQDIIRSASLTQFELYNLREDLSETTDRASEQPARLKAMASQLKALYDEVRKEAPVWPE